MRKKLAMLAAMLAMVLLVAAPAITREANNSIVLGSDATLSQQNTGDVTSTNTSDQTAAQYQYAPGGDATAGDITANETFIEAEYDDGGGDGGGSGDPECPPEVVPGGIGILAGPTPNPCRCPTPTDFGIGILANPNPDPCEVQQR